jgi:hypothetical protein
MSTLEHINEKRKKKKEKLALCHGEREVQCIFHPWLAMMSAPLPT